MAASAQSDKLYIYNPRLHELIRQLAKYTDQHYNFYVTTNNAVSSITLRLCNGEEVKVIV